jgi:hypothetical protein
MTTTAGRNGSPSTASGAPPPPAASEQPRLLRFADVLPALRADAEGAHEARTKGLARGPVTGLGELDDVLGGVLQPGLHVTQGGSGIGKTAFALQVAATCGFPALFVSCEMSLVELLRRHTARATGTFLDRLKSGELAPDDVVRRAEQAIAAAPQLALVDGTRAFVTSDLLLDFARSPAGSARVRAAGSSSTGPSRSSASRSTRKTPCSSPPRRKPSASPWRRTGTAPPG